MRKIGILILLLTILISVTGCVSQNSVLPVREQELIDDHGRKVCLRRKTDRIVVLSPSFLELLHAVGGSVVGRAKSNIASVPSYAQTAEEVGFIFNINTEKVVELKPDLVIAYQGLHEKYIPLLEANEIPVLVLKLKTYEDVKHCLKVIGKAIGQEEKGMVSADTLDKEIAATVRKFPGAAGKKVAILHSTAQSVSLERPESIAGCVAQLLQLKNIITDEDKKEESPSVPRSDKAPYSLEILTEQDPEVIFITSMGDKKAIESRLHSEVMESPAWKSIAAVRNKKVFYLPDELFLLNPGLKYPQAVTYMAEQLYPGVKNAKGETAK